MDRVSSQTTAYPQRLPDEAAPLARLYAASVRHAIETNAPLQLFMSLICNAPTIGATAPAWDRKENVFVRFDTVVTHAVHERLRMLTIIDRLHERAAPPDTSTRDTPGTRSMRGRTLSSAKSCIRLRSSPSGLPSRATSR